MSATSAAIQNMLNNSSHSAASPAASPIASSSANRSSTADSTALSDLSSRVAAQQSGTDERALLLLLQDEVKRLQSSQKSAKQSSANEARTLLEMKVAMEQLEAITEQRRRLTEEVAKERTAAEGLKKKIAQLEADAALKAEQRKVSETHLQEEIAELKQQLTKHVASDDENKNRLSSLEKELNLTRDRAVAAKKEYSVTEQVTFEQTTILKTKLNQALQEIDSLKEELVRESASGKEREYDLSQAVAAAKRERQKVSNDLAAERRAHLEDVTELKKALHEAQQSHTTMQTTFDSNSRIDQEKLIRLTSELQLLKEKANSDADAAKAREKALDEQCMKLVSDLRVAQQEINSMSSQEWTDKKALTQKLIEVTVARDVAVQSANDLKEKLAVAQQDFTHKMAALQHQLTQAQGRIENDAAKYARETQDDRDRMINLEAQIQALQEDNERLKESKNLLNTDTEKALAVKDSELNSTQVELRATVETLHRLEREIQDNVQVKLLTDENASLREQCDALKNRVVEMTSNLANMRAEADTSDNARVSSIQGLVADYHRRIVALEKEQRFSRPVIKDLAAICRKHQLLDAVLERDLELYNNQFQYSAQ